MITEYLLGKIKPSYSPSLSGVGKMQYFSSILIYFFKNSHNGVVKIYGICRIAILIIHNFQFFFRLAQFEHSIYEVLKCRSSTI